MGKERDTMTKWLSHLSELLEKYPRKYLTLMDDEIVSSVDGEFAYRTQREISRQEGCTSPNSYRRGDGDFPMKVETVLPH